jgi:hypothetical protein
MPDIQNQKERAAEVLEQVNLGIEWTTSQISYLGSTPV